MRRRRRAGFDDLDALERHLLAFGRRYEQIAKPFEWKFARRDLERQHARLDSVAAEPVAVKAA